MPRVCTVCAHPEHAGIDAAIVAGQPYRRLASQHNLTEAAIRRHRAHIPASIVRAAAVREATQADDLLGSVRRLRERLETALESAETARDIAALARETRETAKLLWEVEGRLRHSPQMSVGVIVGQATQPLREAVRQERDRRLAQRTLRDARLNEAAHVFFAAVEEVETEVPDTWPG